MYKDVIAMTLATTKTDVFGIYWQKHIADAGGIRLVGRSRFTARKRCLENQGKRQHYGDQGRSVVQLLVIL